MTLDATIIGSTQMTEELKPCPFCGSSDVTMYASNGVPHGNSLAGGTRHVECDDCYASGPAEPSPRDGTAWNTRLSHSAEKEALIEALERLERANDVVAGRTSPRRYLTDLESVQDALVELDDARSLARSTLLSMRNNGNG